ncbi:GNAT family N-acetyltransferase [Rhodanobacter sp. AS-Z3]|uniref:GNAT family N-acetyltransferase n=1 Tax=Rhodanobacter sp. AS-Z3 TaxID=3031330 RepID=UPI00247AA95F|nr:GNAT family N-acetyltransferase [Rhodanobacter sp. AS-Z3]WEN16561.1 GNAT family N-acetyltransferase [Rhodanobacter sp. AS-Z3]
MQMPQIQVETKLTRHAPDPAKSDHWIDKLSDGTRVLVRPIRAEDRQLETDFIMALSPESRRFRFLGDFKRPSEALLDQLLDIDDSRKVAFVALVHDDGHLREIGVSRFAAEPDGQRCECAITISDEWNHRGLGVTLMKHLISVAREKGFAQLFSIDSAVNLPMRDLAKELGFSHHAVADDATLVRYELDL